ncbi:MAG: hypothetical protein J7L73_09280 [Anaerolineales bacterium]|nr:hypothetical protein [Anaerolineales bacterium]
MLTNRDLQELLNYQSQHPVVSVYLNTDPSEGNTEAHRLKLRSLLKDIQQKDDAEAIERYFDHEFDWSGKSVVVFSCMPDDFFRAYTLAIPIYSRIRISNNPHVKPLADLFDLYGGYGIVLIDRQSARYFAINLGQLVDEKEFKGKSVRRIKHGGGSQSAGRKSGEAGQNYAVEEITDRNMREAEEFASHFFKTHKIRRILIGGTEDNIALFKQHLPKTWQSLIIGTCSLNINANIDEVLETALEIGHAAEHKKEAKLVESVITNAAKGQDGVLGLDETLSAVHEGRVQILLFDSRFRASGYRCTGCGYITTQPIDICPFCGNEFEKIQDAVELAVRKVLQSGGDVEVLQGDISLKDHGHIGALLRY